ncbi:MAG TPA: DUF4148 domain-containing protein [Ramlibacter sp.]|jgi:hypothetical protein|uniref:DUF4148 domain-containing protein n=1 Tax=Ramlibacter sp. TaxID=1917967 RepID=UPI002D65AB33|nr:DUF4148 domain-containing protein [Ramlibacter sp.]HZY19766.1 DUF4148 domain-containing protein [Ramlibacter sp.]
MNAKALLAVAAVAAAFSATARAGEADVATNNQPFQGERARAEVRAEAVQAVRNYNFEPNGSRVAAPVQSAVDRQAVRSDTAQAVRLGRIAHGEAAI